MLDPILAPLYLLFTWSKLSCSPLAPGLWLLFQEISNCLNHCLMLQHHSLYYSLQEKFTQLLCLQWTRAHLFVSQVVVKSLSYVQLFVIQWTAAHQVFLSLTTIQSLLKLMPIELVLPSNHFILCHPPFPPAFIFFAASGSFPMSQLFVSGGQSIGASASVLPMNIQG